MTPDSMGERATALAAPRCSAPARRWAPISSDPRCPGWPTGPAARSSRSPPTATRPRTRTDAGVVAQLQRSRARPAHRRGAARQSRTCGPPACASWRRARSSASPAARAIRRSQQVTGDLLWRRRAARSRRIGHSRRWRSAPRCGLQLGTRFLGQVQAQHRVRGCRLPGQHRPVRRRAGADGGPGGRALLLDPHRGGAACASPRENAALQKRSLDITELLFKGGNDSELDVQQAKAQYLARWRPSPRWRSALRQTQNALSIVAGAPSGPAARDGCEARTRSRRPSWT